MPNELVFILMVVFVLCFSLFSFRMGKYWLFGFIAFNIILANIFVTKQFTIFGIIATGGNITYGAIFLSTDLLCEHYSKKDGRNAVLLGFFAALFYLISSQFILILKPAESDIVHDSMKTIFSFAPRIVLASLIAYLISQSHDIWLFHFLKVKTGGRMLWLRNNLSTWVSQLIDSVVFASVAFLGTFQFRVVLEIIISTYVLKILVATLDTPFIYLSYKLRPKELKSRNL